jgi:uncharacterized membrane protein
MQDHARTATARLYLNVLLASALLAGACAGARSDAPPAAVAHTASADASCSVHPVALTEARSLVDQYCVSCHSPSGSAGEDYDFRSDSAILARRRSIEAKLRLQVMPPPNAPQPSAAERSMLRCWAKE